MGRRTEDNLLSLCEPRLASFLMPDVSAAKRKSLEIEDWTTFLLTRSSWLCGVEIQGPGGGDQSVSNVPPLGAFQGAHASVQNDVPEMSFDSRTHLCGHTLLWRCPSTSRKMRCHGPPVCLCLRGCRLCCTR